MNRVVHFEIHAADPERTSKFYSDIFGWDIKEWVIPEVEMPPENRYWVVHTGNEKEAGINGGMVIRRGAAPVDGQAVNAYVCTMDVPAVDEYINKVLKKGGSIALPKMAIKGVGWLAYCKDPEGNIFGMLQSDEKAG